MKRLCLLVALLIFAFALGGDEPVPRLESATNLADRIKKEHPDKGTHLFAEGKNATVNLINTSAPVPAHYHAKHDETVIIVRGTGTMRLGDAERTVRAGDLMFIPQGTPHAFTPHGHDVVAVSVFSPKFDGTDRILLGE
jgi:quercetin dioxygenase-like cupin family protein